VRPLFYETAVIAMPAEHPMAEWSEVSVESLVDEPLIVPERRSRPHSHDLTMDLFASVGLRPRIAQIADEKQTIINLVAAGIGSAIVPRWTSKLALSGVRYVALKAPGDKPFEKLPLAAAWIKQVRDPARDAMLHLLETNIDRYASIA
jgi:DNA-binding transcriptional LysR family regulator